MNILLISHIDLDKVEKTGTGRSVYLKNKYFSRYENVKYCNNKITDEDWQWCDCVYIVQFQSILNHKNILQYTTKPIYYEAQSFWMYENKVPQEWIDLEIEICKKCKKVFCYSTSLIDYFIKNKISKNRLQLTFPGFDIDDFEFIVTYLGNFSSWQNIKLILKLANQLPEITFLLIGESGGMTVANPNVEVLGYKIGKNLHRYLKMSDMFIIPRENSIICETMPGKFADYYLHNKNKILSTNVCDFSKYINNFVDFSENNILNNIKNTYKSTIEKKQKSTFNIDNIVKNILNVMKK